MRDDAVAAYVKKYNQKPQFDENKIFWEASINAREYHTLDDLRKAGKIIEKKTGYRMIYGAIHRDEGHLNDEGQFVKNTHFQILFISLDENGNSMHRITRGKRQLMRDIQTEVARVLNMERGIDKRISGREHLTPRQYKQAVKLQEPIKQELKIAKADLADAKAKIKTLEEALKSANLEARNALKEQGGKREDYAALEQENKQLKNELAELKKVPANVNIDDEMTKIMEKIKKIKNSKRVVAEAETEFANLKNGFGILDRDRVFAFVSEAVALGYAAHEQIRSYVPVLNDVERYKAEAAQAANLKDNKIAKAFFGGIVSKPDVDVDALKKENTALLQTFDKLQKQNERLQGLLKTAEHSLNAKDAQIAELQKNQEGLKLANDSFFLGQAALLSELVGSGRLYVEPKGRYLVESLDDISSGKTAISNFAGIKSGLLSYSPVSSSPKNDLEM
ncbi:mobilization protein [uncultured Campylobacter sp.]|uniref:mobilization protein n=1 Tax=uncultured Campylobacter sp. TaxID=218934 RepID=UPI003211BDD9